MDTYMCIAESLHYSPETITTLLICYIPKQNYKFKKKNEMPEILILLTQAQDTSFPDAT